MLLVGKCHEGEIQHLVRAVGHDDVVGGNAEHLAHFFGQITAGRVGVELQATCLGGRGFQHAGRGRVGRLVGVELDIGAVNGLLARGVGHQSVKSVAEKAAHDQISSKRTVALLACAERPSFSAK